MLGFGRPVPSGPAPVGKRKQDQDPLLPLRRGDQLPVTWREEERSRISFEIKTRFKIDAVVGTSSRLRLREICINQGGYGSESTIYMEGRKFCINLQIELFIYHYPLSYWYSSRQSVFCDYKYLTGFALFFP